MAPAIVAALDPATAVTLLSRLDEERRQRLVALLDPALAKELERAHGVSAGRRRRVHGPEDHDVPGPYHRAGSADPAPRAARDQRIQDVFLVDEEGRLTGAIGLPDLALAEPGTRLESIRATRPVRVEAMTPREDVAAIAESGQVTSVPVVDLGDRLLGVIHHGELVAATQEAASADIQTMVGVSPDERALSRPSFAVRKRLPWLQINLATAFLAAAVVGLFEAHHRAVHRARGAAPRGGGPVRQHRRAGARRHHAGAGAAGDPGAALGPDRREGAGGGRGQRRRGRGRHRPRRLALERFAPGSPGSWECRWCAR